MVDRGNYSGNFDIAYSPINYITEGSTGTRIFKLEWNNAGFAGGDWDDFVNFQIWLYETTNILEIRFGNNNIQDTTDTWLFHPDGPMVAFAYSVKCNPAEADKALWLYGYRNNPVVFIIDSLNPTPPQANISGVPDPGVVYRFSPIPISSTSLMQNNYRPCCKVYPNPNNGTFTFETNISEENNIFIRIFDLKGRVMYESLERNQLSKASKNITGLAPGTYFLQFETRNGVFQQKIQIK